MRLSGTYVLCVFGGSVNKENSLLRRVWGGIWKSFGGSGGLLGSFLLFLVVGDCLLLFLVAFFCFLLLFRFFFVLCCLLSFAELCWVLLGAGPIAEASEASEQSERAKLSGACGCFLAVLF